MTEKMQKAVQKRPAKYRKATKAARDARGVSTRSEYNQNLPVTHLEANN